MFKLLDNYLFINFKNIIITVYPKQRSQTSQVKNIMLKLHCCYIHKHLFYMIASAFWKWSDLQ